MSCSFNFLPQEGVVRALFELLDCSGASGIVAVRVELANVASMTELLGRLVLKESFGKLHKPAEVELRDGVGIFLVERAPQHLELIVRESLLRDLELETHDVLELIKREETGVVFADLVEHPHPCDALVNVRQVCSNPPRELHGKLRHFFLGWRQVTFVCKLGAHTPRLN